MDEAARRDRATGLGLLRTICDVSRETETKLDVFVSLLRRWQPVKNLVGPKTLLNVWARHIADSGQLGSFIASSGRIVDIGSGAGFPGIVLATLLHDAKPLVHVTLVEANSRKVAFLREAARQLDLSVDIVGRRIEQSWDQVGKVDFVTARALAPLQSLVPLSMPWLKNGATGLFLKGQDVDDELLTLPISSEVAYKKYPSITDPTGSVLVVNHRLIAPKDLTR